LELICQSMRSIESELPAKNFFRIDRSSLVNINIVESIDIKKQICILRENTYSQSVEMSLIGLKRLMARLEQK
jgi:DNA-binding LytR/AlgR family response regulator